MCLKTSGSARGLMASDRQFEYQTADEYGLALEAA